MSNPQIAQRNTDLVTQERPVFITRRAFKNYRIACKTEKQREIKNQKREKRIAEVTELAWSLMEKAGLGKGLAK